MQKTLLTALAGIVVIGGIFLLLNDKDLTPEADENANADQANLPTEQTPPQTSKPNTSSPQVADTVGDTVEAHGDATTASPKTFTVQADDETINIRTIRVKKGDNVSITFTVRKDTSYYGGLEFRGEGLSTGTILPGDSKTLSFTASTSFLLEPYWPDSNIKKAYNLSIEVEN